MASRLLLETGDLLLLEDGSNHLLLEDSVVDAGGGRRLRYIAFNMCWALLAVLPLLE